MQEKNKYEEALLTLLDEDVDEKTWYKKMNASFLSGELIKEHFELKEKYNELGKAIESIFGVSAEEVLEEYSKKQCE